jgi:2-amino-4-hydroxy-6-hydroxymethyldihydropteridine diphosphokinase
VGCDAALRRRSSSFSVSLMQEPAVTAFIGIGANLADPAAAVRNAITALAALPHTQLQRASSLYRTAPVDAAGPDFINAVVQLNCSLTAPALLAQLQGIEQAAGRERPYRNAPRTLDLDFLLYGDARIQSPALTVPHPRMHLRAFVLLPLLEIAPQCVIAGVGSAQSSLQGVHGQPIERLPA